MSSTKKLFDQNWITFNTLFGIVSLSLLLLFSSKVEVSKKDLIETWNNNKIRVKSNYSLKRLPEKDAWISDLIDAHESITKLKGDGYNLDDPVTEIYRTNNEEDPLIYRIESKKEVYFVIYE